MRGFLNIYREPAGRAREGYMLLKVKGVFQVKMVSVALDIYIGILTYS